MKMKIVKKPENHLTIEELTAAIALHKKELKLIRMMNDDQYRAFRNNFSVGMSEPSRLKAISILESMIMLNIKMQSDLNNKKKNR